MFTKSTSSITACLLVSNVLNWPWAGGVYKQDDSLEDCTNTGKPRYRQLGGGGFIWNYQNTYWEGTTVMCTLSDSTKQFLVRMDASTPDLVTAGAWNVINTVRSGMERAPDMTVQVTDCGKHHAADTVFVQCAVHSTSCDWNTTIKTIGVFGNGSLVRIYILLV